MVRIAEMKMMSYPFNWVAFGGYPEYVHITQLCFPLVDKTMKTTEVYEVTETVGQTRK